MFDLIIFGHSNFITVIVGNYNANQSILKSPFEVYLTMVLYMTAAKNIHYAFY